MPIFFLLCVKSTGKGSFRICFHAVTGKNSEYLIKWKGWPLKQCTWEPAEHLSAGLLRAVFSLL